MDWTDSQEDAQGVEHQMEMRRIVEQMPGFATLLAALAGAAQTRPVPLSQDQERYASNLRQHAPSTFRAGAYGLPLALGVAGAFGGGPALVGAGAAGLATSAYRDPGLAELLKRFSP